MKRAGVEEERWSKIEAEKKVEDSKWDMKHQQGINGKKNNSRYTSRGEHTTQTPFALAFHLPHAVPTSPRSFTACTTM
jgi:hypothetical protein